jgi:hypothetical protein
MHDELGDGRVVCRPPLREVEDPEDELHRVVRRLVAHARALVVDEELDAAGPPIDRVPVRSRGEAGRAPQWVVGRDRQVQPVWPGEALAKASRAPGGA